MTDDAIKNIPLHLQIAERLRHDLRLTGRPGEKFGSQNELALRFGVSAITIREAVGALVQEGLLERRHGSGTYVRDAGANQAIGVLIELDISCPGTSFYWTRLTQELRLAFEAAGHATRLYAGHTRSGEPPPERPTCTGFWQDLAKSRIRALVIVGTDVRDEWRRDIEAHGVLVATTHDNGPQADSHYNMIRAGTRRLIEHGCRRPGVMAFGTAASPDLAYRAFAEEMAAQDLPISAARTAHVGTDVYDGLAGVDDFRRLWRQPAELRPDGLLVGSDRLVRPALAAIRLLDVAVPEELIIAAHTHRGEINGDLPFPIIRLEVDPAARARHLADILLHKLAGEPPRPDPDLEPYRIIDPLRLPSVSVTP